MTPAERPAEGPIITLSGPHVALGPPHRDLLPLLARWENDLALSVLSGDPARPVTLESLQAAYDRYSRGDERDLARFVIYERPTLHPIGETGLRQINHAHGTATFGISIGERACWGRGYGTEATLLVLDYGFSALGLHNIMLQVVGYNERAIRAYRRAGFRDIGRRRQSYRLGGRVYDEVLMECLATEFHSPLAAVLEPPGAAEQLGRPRQESGDVPEGGS
jgi:RimJ/RimL family protein N-acetyltransferase